MRLARYPAHIACVVSLLLCALAQGCTPSPGENWNAEQKSVYDAMQSWSKAVSNRNIDAMWDMLTPDAQEVYERELKGRRGIQETVRQLKAGIGPDARTPADERARIEKALKELPPEPEKMTGKDYYRWRVTPDMTPTRAANNAALFAKANIVEISVQGGTATVVLKDGQPDRYSWKKSGGDWKFDLPASILRALEATREREAQGD